MALTTSSRFASAMETGTDWRDTSKKVLEALESVRTPGNGFNFGFLYVSDHLAGDLTSILNLFKSVLHIEHWTGCVGIGVCGNGAEHIDAPAISAMIGYFPDGEFTLFPPVQLGESDGADRLSAWLAAHDPMLALTHASPAGQEDPALVLKKLDDLTGGFITGGLSSSRTACAQIAGDIYDEGISGVLFSANVPVATALSQGCKPAGGIRAVTRCNEHTIYEIDQQSAVSVFEKDMREMVVGKIGKDPNDFTIKEEDLDNPDVIPPEFRETFKGEMHAAFPVSGSDRNDYLVRNIIGLDDNSGSISVAQTVLPGEHILFVYRDDATMREDLSSTLLDLRARVKRERGAFEPKAAIYVSCLARAFCNFQGGTKTGDPSQCGEMQLIREILGDIPLTGFYAASEISKGRLYGYTGILTLFL